ncbi:GNAT family protein [Pigmentibacter sp. JX0631]|uniref:GNAT family N-acetyltransferase n=1 Tax=Pigmentibacter sp. JX0631 TaxID=2976982 RepID=UPI0024687BB9|nr:GNAT family protein [Pigmentibacter sp. JX0631]WGL61121.1 GNAT family protein [Pigmentibacter sp. JX0631]
MKTHIILNLEGTYYLSEVLPHDKPSYLEHFKEKQIYDQTLNIPFPYTEANADWWINYVTESTLKIGKPIHWAIRNSDGKLIGGIGLNDFEIGKSYKTELGYWLAKPFWNKGIMTNAVKAVTDLGLNEYGLIRITAHVFDFNIGSAKVLEKAGYSLEGILRKNYQKDGKIFDGKLYAIVKE